MPPQPFWSGRDAGILRYWWQAEAWSPDSSRPGGPPIADAESRKLGSLVRGVSHRDC